MKKLIVVGSLAAGLVALAAWRMKQSKQNAGSDYPIPEDLAQSPREEEPVGI